MRGSLAVAAASIVILGIVVAEVALHARLRNEIARAPGGPATLAAGESALDQLEANGSALLVTSGTRTARELDSIASFHERGGVVLVDDDRQVAAQLGVEVLPSVVVDARGPGVPRPPHPVIDPRPGARVLVASSNESFVDVDGDGKPSAGDAFGPFALVVASPDGRVIVAGGPDIARFAPLGATVIVESASADALTLGAIDIASVPWLGALVGVVVGAAGLVPLIGRSRL